MYHHEIEERAYLSSKLDCDSRPFAMLNVERTDRSFSVLCESANLKAFLDAE